MAETYPKSNRPYRFALATTLKRIDYIEALGVFPQGSREIPIFLEITPDVDCYIVNDGASVDTGALPTHYDKVFAGTTRRWEIRGADPILLAGVSAGDCTVTLR